MVKIAKGNLVFMASNESLIVSVEEKNIQPQLTWIGSGDAYTTMGQPGILRGFNMYVGTSLTTGNNIVTATFQVNVWDGDKDYTERTVTLFTILAGETGYFCFDEADI